MRVRVRERSVFKEVSGLGFRFQVQVSGSGNDYFRFLGP